MNMRECKLAVGGKWGLYLSLLCFFILHPFFCFRAWAQTNSVGWYKIPGGGGTSTNDQYAVTGAIGQADAGAALAGGNFSITGGFWSLIGVLQTAGLPNLCITPSSGSVTVSWPSSAAGCVLEQTSDLAAPNWTASGYTVCDDGTNKSITITSPAGNLFFRLKQ